jgi:hypothetical protein
MTNPVTALASPHWLLATSMYSPDTGPKPTTGGSMMVPMAGNGDGNAALALALTGTIWALLALLKFQDRIG